MWDWFRGSSNIVADRVRTLSLNNRRSNLIGLRPCSFAICDRGVSRGVNGRISMTSVMARGLKNRMNLDSFGENYNETEGDGKRKWKC
ncbi:hypothetical protein O6P43_017099 [Quillaja saponaria]|uniref:Uncharacterized protein n=1 Tax=Quillaja saponaria TaxID=32244 RepID=A0AAD7LPG4_QUISA|nr:hypothetical protein O6P43_017099 [Quillaja saponaria]